MACESGSAPRSVPTLTIKKRGVFTNHRALAFLPRYTTSRACCELFPLHPQAHTPMALWHPRDRLRLVWTKIGFIALNIPTAGKVEELRPSSLQLLSCQ
jgi:hypothetical protein